MDKLLRDLKIDGRAARWMIAGYIVALLGCGWVLVTYRLPHQILIVMIAPILFAALRYPRWVYLTMVLAIIAPAVWVTWALSSQFSSSVVTLLIAVPTLGVIAEVVNQMSARYKRTEHQLREQEAHYRMLVENQGEGVALVDAQESFVFANPAAEQIFGVPPGELRGKSLRVFTTPAQFTAMQAQTGKRRAGEKSSYELEIIRPDGDPRALILTATPHFDSDGQYIGAFGVFRDITDRKRAEEALARRDAILNAATLAAERFLRTSAWQDQISQVMAHLGEATQVSRIYIFENHWDRDGILHWSQRYEWVAPYVAPQISQIEIRNIQPLANGFERWVKTLEQGKWLQGNVKDFPPSEQTSLIAQNIRSVVVVPVFVQATWWGLIGFDECLRERTWSPAEIDALVMATDTLGAAIGREWIDAELRTRAHHLELLNKITDVAIAAPNLAQMLQTIADRLGKLLDADGCYITLWDESRQVALRKTAYGALREMYLKEPAEFGVTMTESVLRAGHALAADDVFNSPYVNPQEAVKYPTRALLGLPLIARGKKLGAAMIGFNHPHHFTPDEMERGEQAARHIALAIAKAQALEAEQQRAAELETVHSAGLSLTSTLDRTTVLENILQSTFRLSPDAKDAHIFLYRNERVQFAASLWTDGRKDQQFAEPRTNGLTYTVARRGETAVIPDMSTHPLFADAPHLWGGAIIGLPLKIGARVVGVMNVAYQDTRAFSKNELRVLELLAGQAAIAIENARLFDETKQRAARMSALNEIGQALTSTLKLEQLYRLIYQQARRVLTADAFFVAIYDESHSTIHFPLMYDNGVELPNEIHPLGSGPTSHIIRTRAPYLANRSSDAIFHSGSHFGTLSKTAASAIFVPMMLGTRVLGVISAQSYREGSYHPEDIQVLETIAAQAAIALENARLYDEVQQLAITDEVTGLLNRRGLFQLGQREVERAIRYQRPLAAMMLDIDQFKQVNDTYGHLAGDRVLRALADCCRESIRTLDIAGRYGGEEFFLLLPETDLVEAVTMAERLRRAVEQMQVQFGHSQISFTISLGVAAMAPDISNLATLIERADQAQYLAKQAGRNRVQKYG